MILDKIVPFLVTVILLLAEWVVSQSYSLCFSIVCILLVVLMKYYPNWICFLRAKRDKRPVEDRSFLKKFARDMIISFALIIGALVIRYFRAL